VFEYDANAEIPFVMTMFEELNLIVQACAEAVNEETCVALDSPGLNSPHRAQVLQSFCAIGRQV
jgi:hypothetical protein